MTVIAATNVHVRGRQKVRAQMSADTFSHTKVSGLYVHKIERIGTTLVGCAGPSLLCQRFLKWRHNGGPPPVWKQDDPFEALVLDITGLYVFYSGCTPERVQLPWFAIGSGRQYAIGALANGATTDKAVEIACQFDPYSKTPVETLRL